ncbi:MAG: DUF4258 domain-containing protein [Candidatus Dadabacteria bacterium]|nr:MAG: DUF4258 domain-containing protein [Candidatus Dadabacteria bacterium]
MSKPVRYSGHALENLRARKIDKTEVEKTIASPERKEPGHPRSRVVYMRRCHDERLDKQVLLRVVIEETKMSAS